MAHPQVLIGFSDAGARPRNMAYCNFGVRFLELVHDAAERGAPVMTTGEPSIASPRVSLAIEERAVTLELFVHEVERKASLHRDEACVVRGLPSVAGRGDERVA